MNLLFRTISLFTLLLCTASAQTPQTTLTLNGQSVSLSTVTVSGKAYVSLDQLRAALNAAGGANALGSQEGCRGQWLFNGIWRMKVTDVTALRDDSRGGHPGWGVTVEFRNGTKEALSLYHTGLEKGTSLALTTGDTWARADSSAWADMLFKKVPQGAGSVFQYRFWAPDSTDKKAAPPQPDKLVITVDPGQLKNHNLVGKVSYTTPNPSFRVNLRCSK
ncbi:hypothetical protein [Deinococcus hopiensis]|uniref:Uncharacterized protein n=1 Tax=Deinococcus hopiensis KR-140 TaxID=695939 RepID=A0A1W1UNN7_9DEIO|nr:hypothetical protein [Deinococcus hopiensis]SMB82690.1 hypothetical protein SAMN00790413_04108 [Deinococcus hopiensis KR-140]